MRRGPGSAPGMEPARDRERAEVWPRLGPSRHRGSRSRKDVCSWRRGVRDARSSKLEEERAGAGRAERALARLSHEGSAPEVQVSPDPGDSCTSVSASKGGEVSMRTDQAG